MHEYNHLGTTATTMKVDGLSLPSTLVLEDIEVMEEGCLIAEGNQGFWLGGGDS